MGNKKLKISSILLYAVLIFWLLITVIPILWVFENSFKPSEEILLNGVAFPKSLDFSNYRSIFSYPDVNMFRSFFNSFLISGGVVAGVVCFGGLAAFGLGRFDSGVGKVVEAGMVACLLVPAFATMIPNFVTVSRLPIRETYLAVIVPQVAGNLCFAIMLLSSYMRSLPNELDEAAIIDGSTHVFDTATFTVGGEKLEDLIANNADYAKYEAYVSDGYFHESELASAPAFDIAIDGITMLG